MTDDGSPLRLVTFPTWPQCLLVLADEHATAVVLPQLLVPFTRDGVRAACRAAGVGARVSDGVPGRFTAAMAKAKREARAERGQRQTQREAVQTTTLRGTPLADSRAELIERKHRVDAQIQALKAAIGKAKSDAFTCGRYMNSAEFHSKGQRLGELKIESQAIQVSLGRLREREREADRREYESEAIAFMKAARRILNEDTFAHILDEAEANDDN